MLGYVQFYFRFVKVKESEIEKKWNVHKPFVTLFTTDNSITNERIVSKLKFSIFYFGFASIIYLPTDLESFYDGCDYRK